MRDDLVFMEGKVDEESCDEEARGSLRKQDAKRSESALYLSSTSTKTAVVPPRRILGTPH